MDQRIITLIQEKMPQIIKWRRYLHMHPELSDNEYNTQDYLINELNQQGINNVKKIATTGVVALITNSPSCCVALRSDIDALPVMENTGLSFSSKNSGIMHACGHDAHMAILLGSASVLNELKAELPVSVKLLFQPAEETTGGAKRMIDEKVLENPKVDAVFGLHIDPYIKTGHVWTKKGAMYACCDTFDIVIKGKSAHAARPTEGISAITIAGDIIAKLSLLNEKYQDSVIISIGTMNAGTIRNVIPDEAVLKGTIRTLDENTRQKVLSSCDEIVKTSAQKYRGSADFTIMSGYPVLYNNDGLFEYFTATTQTTLPIDALELSEQALYISEDFAYFNQYVPSLFYNLGVLANPKIKMALHTPTLDIDEEALYYGVLMQVALVLNYHQWSKGEKNVKYY